MKLRPLSIAVAILVVLAAAVWFARRPRAAAAPDARVGQALLSAEVAERAARVRLADQGRAVELARQADRTWIVPSYHDFPADFAKLSSFVSELTEAKIQRLVTARPERLSRLEFKDAAIVLLDEAGKELWQVSLGRHAERGGRYVRFGAEEKGYLADLHASLDAEAKNWADATLLNLPPDSIARVEIGFADGSPVVIATRNAKDAPWTAEGGPAGKRLKTDRLNRVLADLANLRFSDTTPTDDPQAVAARAHSRTIKLGTFDGKSYVLTLGRKPEEKKPKPEKPAEAQPAEAAAKPTPEDAPAAPKPAEPEFETVPAGPVFVAITASDEKAAVNALMKKRAFQIGEWIYTGLPAAPAELWEDAPAETKPAEPAAKP